MTEGVLEEAQRLVHGPRQADYGRPIDNFAVLADLISAYLGDQLKEPLRPEQAAMCMVLVKVAREKHKHHRDNLVDGAGYFAVVELIHQQRTNRQAPSED